MEIKAHHIMKRLVQEYEYKRKVFRIALCLNMKKDKINDVHVPDRLLELANQNRLHRVHTSSSSYLFCPMPNIVELVTDDTLEETITKHKEKIRNFVDKDRNVSQLIAESIGFVEE